MPVTGILNKGCPSRAPFLRPDVTGELVSQFERAQKLPGGKESRPPTTSPEVHLFSNVSDEFNRSHARAWTSEFLVRREVISHGPRPTRKASTAAVPGVPRESLRETCTRVN